MSDHSEYVCPSCGNTIWDPQDRERHYEETGEEGPMICKKCGKRYEVILTEVKPRISLETVLKTKFDAINLQLTGNREQITNLETFINSDLAAWMNKYRVISESQEERIKKLMEEIAELKKKDPAPKPNGPLDEDVLEITKSFVQDPGAYVVEWKLEPAGCWCERLTITRKRRSRS